MKHKTLFSLVPILRLTLALGVLLIGLPGAVRSQGPEPQSNVSAQQDLVGTGFTYQGRLFDDGSPANGTFDFEFKLYDADSGDDQVGSTVIKDDVTVTDGIFAVRLGFGANVFTGEERWLEISVRPGDQTGDLVTLTPRQELTPAPHALALPGLRTEPNDTSPNVIGGYRGNTVTPGVVGAAIHGGGVTADPSARAENEVTDNYGTIGGGQGNLVGDQNDSPSDASYATIGGGFNNDATASYAMVGGGSWNDADGQYATVGGGTLNEALGICATIPGGFGNDAVGDFSFAAGYFAKADDPGSFVWADSSSTARTTSNGPNQFVVRATGGVEFVGDMTLVGKLNSGTPWTDDNLPDPQCRVSESCPAGSSIRVINPDGSVECETDDTGDTGDALTLRSLIVDDGSGRRMEVPPQRPDEHYTLKVVGDPMSAIFEGSGVGLPDNNAIVEIWDTTGGVWSKNLILAGQLFDPAFRVTVSGEVYADGAYHCSWGDGSDPEPGTCIWQGEAADFAEMLPGSEDLEPGDVLVVTTDGKLACSTRAYQSAVVGVYSTQPGYLGNSRHWDQDGYAPLAVVGIVPVKVSAENGSIQPGDLLTTSDTPGYAMKAGPNPPTGTVLGKALEGLNEGTGVIQILVMLQ